MQPENSTPQKKSNRGRNIIILAVVVIAVIVVGVVAAMNQPPINQNGQTENPSATIYLTGNDNLQINYESNTNFLGPNSQTLSDTPLTLTGGQVFTFTITLNNGASVITSHSINGFSLNTAGFILDSVSPSTPYSLSPGASATFTLTITAPNTNYNGPLTVVVDAS